MFRHPPVPFFDNVILTENIFYGNVLNLTGFGIKKSHILRSAGKYRKG